MVVPTKVIPRLSQLATDSDLESDVDFTDTDSEDSADYYMGRRGSSSRTGGWRSWCTLMWIVSPGSDSEDSVDYVVKGGSPSQTNHAVGCELCHLAQY